MNKKNNGLFSRLRIAVICVILLVSFLPTMYAAKPADANAPYRLSVSMRREPTSKGFCWYTAELTESVVKIYRNGIDVSAGITFSEVACTAWQGAYMHKVTVSGLAQNTAYTYRVGDGIVWSEEGRFVTGAADNFEFITIADVQASSPDGFRRGAEALQAAFDTVPDAAFVVNCGDFTNDSTNQEWDYYDTAFAALNRMAPIAPVSGNHDGFGAKNWFVNMFNLDTSESVQTKNGVNYSFDYANAHFAVLNTNDLVSVTNAQLRWLENDLNSTDKDWKIVVTHKAPYTLGKNGKWPDAQYLRKELTAVMDRCSVDMVISGHDHLYIRTKPLFNNALAQNGTVYLLAGTAGTKRYEIRSFLADSFLDMSFVDALVVQKGGYGNYWNGSDWNSTAPENIGGCFVGFRIDGGELTMNAYILADEKDGNGNDVITKIDTLTLSKETGQNIPTFSGDNTTGEFAYYMNTVASVTNLLKYTFSDWLPVFLRIVPRIIKTYITEGVF